MNRRKTLKALGGAALAGAAGLTGQNRIRRDRDDGHRGQDRRHPMVQRRRRRASRRAAKDFDIDASMVGPANVDPAQQVKLLEDLIAKKVDRDRPRAARRQGLRAGAQARPGGRHQGHHA